MTSSFPRMFACLGFLVALCAPGPAQGSDAPPVDTLWVTVHGHRIAFYVAGDAAAPVVILEPGGGGHDAWGDLPVKAAQFARVVTYDRPGYGQSEKCTRERSAAVITEELHEALAAIGIKPPFVLGGWSMGGPFVRVFGSTYPDDVAGLLLIDPAPEDFYERAARERADVWKPMLEQQKRRVATRGPGHQGEWAAWDETMRQARASDSTLKAPVVLLTATEAEDELQDLWIEEHRKWAERMPNVSHVLVEGAGHAIHRDEPEAVLLALRSLLPGEPIADNSGAAIGSPAHSERLTRESIAAGRSADIRELDPSLPSVALEQWLASLPGAQQVTWESNDCGEQTGTPEPEPDFPICAEARVAMTDGRTAVVMVVVGTYRGGIEGPPHFLGAYVIDAAGAMVDIESLPDLQRTFGARAD